MGPVKISSRGKKHLFFYFDFFSRILLTCFFPTRPFPMKHSAFDASHRVDHGEIFFMISSFVVGEIWSIKGGVNFWISDFGSFWLILAHLRKEMGVV